MMKHLFSFLIIASLLLFGCRSKTQSNFQPELSEQAEESYSLPEEYAEEVIVTGKVLNRDFYPNLSSTYKCNFLGADNKQ